MIKNAIISSALMLGCSTVALADLQIYSANVERVKNEAKVDGRYGFLQTGVSNDKTSLIKGFGNNMPLSISLEAIVPKDSWRIDINDGAESLLVNWKGNHPWPYVLENLARDNNLKVNIDWSNRVVDVYSQEVAMRKVAEAAEKERLAKVAEAKRISDKAESERALKESIARKELLAAETAAKKALAESRLAIKKAQDAKDLADINRIKQEKMSAAKALKAKQENDKRQAALDKSRNIKSDKYFSSIISPERNGPIKKQKTLTIGDFYEMSNVRPLDGDMRNLVNSVYNKTFNESTKAIFILKKGVMLSDNINMWSAMAGWSFERNSKNDYMITRDITFKGSLKEAISKTVDLYKESTKPLKIEMHKGNEVVEMKDFIFTSGQVGGERIGTQKN